MSDFNIKEHFFAVWRDADNDVVGFIPLTKAASAFRPAIEPVNDCEAISLAKVATVELIAAEPKIIEVVTSVRCEVRATPFSELTEVLQELLGDDDNMVQAITSEFGEKIDKLVEGTRLISCIVDMPGVYGPSDDQPISDPHIVEALQDKSAAECERIALEKLRDVQNESEELYYSALSGWGHDRYADVADWANTTVHVMAARLNTVQSYDLHESETPSDVIARISEEHRAELDDFLLGIPVLKHTILRDVAKAARRQPTFIQDGLGGDALMALMSEFDNLLNGGE